MSDRTGPEKRDVPRGQLGGDSVDVKLEAAVEDRYVLVSDTCPVVEPLAWHEFDQTQLAERAPRPAIGDRTANKLFSMSDWSGYPVRKLAAKFEVVSRIEGPTGLNDYSVDLRVVRWGLRGRRVR
jgi:hypothetical protein